MDDLDQGTDTLRGYVSLLHGPTPKLVPCQSETEELEELVEWIRTLPADEIRLADIGVLCSRRTDVDRVQWALPAAGIDTVGRRPETDRRT